MIALLIRGIFPDGNIPKIEDFLVIYTRNLR